MTINHPNSVISSICSRAGIDLSKGDAARIHDRVPDLDPGRILEVAREVAGPPRPRKRRKKKKDRPPASLNTRIRKALEPMVNAFFRENPEERALRGEVEKTAREHAHGRLHQAGETALDPLPSEILDEALEAGLTMARESVAIADWLAQRTSDRPVMRSLLTRELWRSCADNPEALESALVAATGKALRDMGHDGLRRIGPQTPDPAMVSTLLRTPIPVDGVDPLERERRRLQSFLDTVIANVEHDCWSGRGTFRRSTRRRLQLLDMAIPGLSCATESTRRLAEIEGLMGERAAEQSARLKREREVQRQRKAMEARLIRRDELERQLPATAAETHRWIADGRIPVVMRKAFRKWGKDLTVSLHDPDRLPEWRAQLDDWRRKDAEARDRVQADARKARALKARVVNLVKLAVPEGSDLIDMQFHGGKAPWLLLSLEVEVDLPLRPDVPTPLRVPLAFRLLPQDWSAVEREAVKGKARAAAAAAIRDKLVREIDGMRRDAASGMEELARDFRQSLADLPEEAIDAFIEMMSVACRTSKRHILSSCDIPGHVRQVAGRVFPDIPARLKDRILGRASGLSDYPSLFHRARRLRRHFHLHVGPTNSGKTHAAMERLRAARTGLYAAPLRLMAMEWAERLTAEGVPTDLVTGEEVIRSPGASHVSATIEMCDFRSTVDVAVIDEGQMIADPQRGWAWTQAVLGLPASEIHVTGQADMEPWIRSLADMTGDVVHVHRHERLVPLDVMSEPVSAACLREGDAIIAFSRAGVLRIAGSLRSRGISVSTVYGALSPEVRREQAGKFRKGRSAVLVATDAIGMGLNLPIRRVLFSEAEKFDGVERRALKPAEIRQIAGRAGRFGLSSEAGLAGAFDWPDRDHVGTCRIIEMVGKALKASPQPDPSLPFRPLVMPGTEVIRTVADALGTDRLAPVLWKIHRDILGGGSVFVSGITEDMLWLARMMDDLPLGLEDRYGYSCAPADSRDGMSLEALLAWSRRHAKGRTVPFVIPGARRIRNIRSRDDLADAESQVKAAGLYLWCSFRWPAIHHEPEKAVAARQKLNAAISRALDAGELRRNCRDCGRILPAEHGHGICDSCHQMRRLYC